MKHIALLLAAAAATASAGTVIVVVDMDASRPGIQNTVDVPPGTTVVPGVAVYIYAPQGGASMMNIGYIGGIDRGIAFGHMPGNQNVGSVTSLTAHQGTAVIPGNNGLIEPGFDPAFIGPEVQYGEFGPALTPQPIPTTLGAPIFTVDVNLNNATHGDVFRFFLCDYVRIWSGGTHGAFSTQSGMSLDTGGDFVPDGTLTSHGVDLDTPIPVPPAAFRVDFVDGAGGATITIDACYANCDQSTTVPVLNVQDFGCFLNRFGNGELYANCDNSTTPPVLNVQDFSCFLNKYAAGCS